MRRSVFPERGLAVGARLRKQALPLEARPVVRLDHGRPVGPLTRAKRDAATVDFRHWLDESVGVSLEDASEARAARGGSDVGRVRPG